MAVCQAVKPVSLHEGVEMGILSIVLLGVLVTGGIALAMWLGSSKKGSDS